MAVILNASTSSGFVQSADTSGDLELQSNGTTKLTVSSTGVNIPTLTATTVQGAIVQGTAVASTSGTSIDFTGIPSWAKKITVMFAGVSTNGTSLPMIQIGSGSTTTTGYVGVSGSYVSGVSSTVYGGSGFPLTNVSGATDVYYGLAILTNVSSNSWVASINGSQTGTNRLCSSNGSLALGGVLDRVRITTVNGTDTFDAGTINIQYEG